MKFTFKLILSVTTIIAIIFSVAGIIMINKNFEYSMEESVNQNIDSHNLQKYGIEENIVNHILEDGKIDNENLVEYAKNLATYLGKEKSFSIFVNNEKIYSNMEIDIKIEKSENINYLLKEIGNEKYIIIVSALDINNQNITISSMYNITKVFTEKDRQLADFYVIDILVIFISSIAVCILSIFLTKPIRKLNEMSKKISKGSYDERIDIKTNDEIGELAKSFNTMIETIESKINELEDLVKQKEEFITNFTHELKNPMTSIIGYADILRTDKYDNETKLRAANYIFREGKRLEILAHKLMDLMELSNENVKFEVINVRELMNDIYQNLQNSLGDNLLELDIEDEYIFADYVLLEDCIRNLIDNSKKAEPKDKKIRVVGRKKENKYQIEIIDKGCGIPKEEIPKITESFYMVDKSRARSNKGSGIGLAICEKIANLHHTKLEFTSKLGKGTKVSILLEVAKNEN